MHEGLFTKFRIGAAALALALMAGGSTAQGQVIVGAVDGVINSGGPGFGALAHTWNQAGLSSNYVSGVTDFATYIGSNPTHTFAFLCCEWFSNQGTISASVTYDLGAIRAISALALWNEDESGIGLLDLWGSADGISLFPLSLGLKPFDNPPFVDYPAEVFNFSSTNLRYIRFDMSNCPQPDGTRFPACSIGEVAFRADISPVPEPATYAMMLPGLIAVGLAARRRRRSP